MSHRTPSGRSARVALAPMGLAALALGLASASAPALGPADAGPRRAPWTGSKLAGTPEPPPPYVVEPAFPHVTFRQPVLLAATPAVDRVFVGELGGKIYSLPADPNCRSPDLAVDLAASRRPFGSLYGMAFHPRFAENRQVFLCFAEPGNRPDGTKVARYRVTADDPPRIDPASEEVLLTFLAGGHNAGCLQFGPDGYLYIATGDAADPTPPDPFDTGQDISDLLSSILRIDVDRAQGGLPYRIPPDNPFVGLPDARGEVWAFGFRNPWRFSFDRESGTLWAGDVGWELWEMIHKVDRGGNYGWSLFEASQPVRPESRRGPGPVIPPVIAHPHSEAASMTGGYVYRGTRLPGLRGVYVYGDFQSGKVWGLRHDGERMTWQGELAETPLQLVSFGEDNAGELYLLDYERSQQIYRLEPNPSAGRATGFPRTLSETGLFASTADHTPASGVVSYAVNAEIWADGTHADRLVAVPGDGRLSVRDSGFWDAPEGSALARTVWVELERGNPSSRKKVETQLLHFEEGSWRPYTYVWDDDGLDATLADPQGFTRTYSVADPEAPGGRRRLEYRVAARSECTLCHNAWVVARTTVFGRQSASPLAFNTAQLDRGDQLDRIERLGLLERRPESGPGARLVDPYDPHADLDRRARSYLHVNCAHCHQFGAGGSTTLQLGAGLSLEQTQTVGAPPVQGDFGIDDARVIAPGDPEGSVLYYRVAKMGGGRMPRIGSHEVDAAAVRMLRDWIAALPGAPGRADDGGADEPIERALESTRGALRLMARVDAAGADDPWRAEAIAKAMGHPRGEVRDLFERFVPGSERVERLGDAFDAAALLARSAQAGDPARGKLVFADAATQCRNCHVAEGVGKAVGPPLDGIGAKYPPAELLRHILEPSLLIEPAYAASLVETADGRVRSGVLVSRDEREVVLRDAEGNEARIPVDAIEEIAPQPKSLMPEGLFRDLTPEQASDLLAYLSSLGQGIQAP